MAGPRGELVGDAYVRIHADSNPMRRELKRSAGKDVKAYTSTFGDEVEEAARNLRLRMRRQLAEGLVDPSVTRATVRRVGDVTVAFDGLRESLQHMSEQGQLNQKELAAFNAELNRQETAIRESMKAAEEKMAQEAREREARKLQMRVEKDHTAAIIENRRRLDRAAAEAAALRIRLERDYARALVENAKRAQDAIDREQDILDQRNRRLGRFADAVGAAFGRGSRNNLLNFTGSVIRNLTLATVSIGRFGENVTEFAASFIKAFTDAREGGAGLFKALSTAGASSFASIHVAAATFVAAIAAGALILPVFTALISTLAGAIAVLAGALTYAVIGTLLPLGPVLMALLPAGYAVVRMFRQMGEEGTAMRNVTGDLRKSFKDMKKELDLPLIKVAREVNELGDTVGSFVTPLLVGMAYALRGVASALNDSLDDPSTKRFLKLYEESLPKIVNRLGRGLVELNEALIAFFAPILPFAERLANNFNNLMTRFSDWASSAKGQNAIEDFMEDAWTAADRLWSILGNLVSAFGKVFGISQEKAGGDLLAYLDRITEKFDTWLGTEEGREATRGFFEDVRDVMVTIKDIIGDIAVAFDEFDSEQARADLVSFLSTVQTVTTALDSLARFLGEVKNGMTGRVLTDDEEGLFAGFGEQLGRANVAVDEFFLRLDAQIIAGWNSAREWTTTQISSLGTAVSTGFAAFPGLVVTALASLALSISAPFALGAQRVRETVAALPASVAAHLAAMPGSIAGALVSVASQLLAPFTRGRTLVDADVGRLVGLVPTLLSSLPGLISGALAGVAGRLTSPFSTARDAIAGIVGEILGFIGSITRAVNNFSPGNVLRDVARRIGVPRMAYGGITSGLTLAGEDGREAVIPLTKPLSQVDPSVRELAAIARGLRPRSSAPSTRSGRNVTVEAGAVVVQTASTDSRQVAGMVVDRLAAALAF